MNRRSKLAERTFFATVALLLLLNLGMTTTALRLASADDTALARGLSLPAQAAWNRMHDFRIGRIYADAKFALLEQLMLVPSDAVHAALRIGAFLGALLTAAWFTWEWRRSERAVWLVVCAGSGFLPVAIAYQALLSYPLLWIGWAGVWTMGALALRPESAWGRSGIAVAFAVALAAHESNAVFLVWPAMLRRAAGDSDHPKTILREAAPCAVVLSVYAALSWGLRSAALAATTADVYDGAKVALDFRGAVFALCTYTGSGLPGLDSWLARNSDPSGPLWLSLPAWWHRAGEWTTPLSVVGASLLGAAVWLGTAADEGDRERPRIHAIGIGAALGFAAFAPNLLLALTVKYQAWAHQRMWPYYYTSMSYLAWLVLLVGVGAGLLAALRNAAAHRTVRVALAAGVIAAAIGVSAANHEAAGLLLRHTFIHMVEYRQWMLSP